MRIIAGKYRSLPLEAVKGNHTRPTTDKIKEAVFNSVGPYFDGGEMLDLYAGSGSVGLECISRGMDHAVFVDKSYDAISTIKKNIGFVKVPSQCTVYKMDALAALRRCADEKRQFDLVYLDPPYAQEQNEKVMTALCQMNLLKQGAVVIVESLKEDVFSDEIGSLMKYKEAVYGITRISYYEVKL
ncbi:MAG: 16S rRNA (guanine(966)-N(2))-methyltransferase RsmD [Erysipelotrichaceae bacterium]|nr:16S rRNA (guanine(966)-N(2))-methyltransferase RsmD [Erysipelotrichaceae bacterium]